MVEGSSSDRDTRSYVVPVALAMVLAQAGLRGWGALSGWFQADDLVFGSRVLNEPFGWHLIFSDHVGHLMPAGFLATWLNFQIGPWTYWPFAVELVALQVLASAGFVVLLISAFGRRPGILPPLALFLFTSFTLPSDLWWAVGINQLPALAAFGWGGWTLLAYLRTGQARWAISSVLITAAALAFQERSLLLEVLYAFVALAYFSNGDIVERLKQVISRFRLGVGLHAVLVLGYLTYYVSAALKFAPGTSSDQSLPPLLSEMGLHGVVPAVLGGPLHWASSGSSLPGFPDPPELLVWPCAALIALVAVVVHRSRTRSLRVWWLVGGIFAAQIVLVAASRSYLVGPQIGRDYRYTTEMAAAVALALALATMELIGADERVEVRSASSFLDHPWRVGIATAVVVALSGVSTLTFTRDWTDQKDGKVFFANVAADLTRAKTPVALIDAPLPDNIWDAFGLSYPLNLSSHMLKPWEEHTYFPTIATNHLSIAARDGHIRPVLITNVRSAAPTDAAAGACPWKLGADSVAVPMNGPVMGLQWWVRVTYTADAAGEIDVIAGERHHRTTIEPGDHTLFFTAEGQGFTTVEFRREIGTGSFCVSGLTLGQPYADGDTPPKQ